MTLIEKQSQSKNIQLIVLGLYSIAIVILGYFTERSETIKVFTLFGSMFLAYVYFMKKEISLKAIILGGILLRASQLWMLPNLSDDYFRFIWDGLLLQNGMNPFYYLPSYFIEINELPEGLSKELYSQLNSPNYYTIYPPLCQFTFWVGGFFAKDSSLFTVVAMRSFVLLSEIGTLILLPRLLSNLDLKPEQSKWYALNPLVVVELTGNLHYEALMIFFLLLSLYWLQKQKLVLSAIAFSFSVGSKLLPLMFLPLLLFYLGWKKAFAFYFTCAIGLLLLFAGFLDLEMINNMRESFSLYFNRFEFNASVYYIVRWIGFQVKGYNIIGTAGVRLTYIPIILILVLSLIKTKSLQTIILRMLLVMSVYYFTATIIHPWYISTLVFFSAFTNFRFAMLWSGLAIFSYATYRDSSYQEIFTFTTIEYLAVYTVFFYELYKNGLLKKGQIISERYKI